MENKSYRIIDGKPRCVIVDETGNIVNRNPNKDELKGLKKEIGPHGNTRNISSTQQNCDGCKTLFVKYRLHKEYKKKCWTGRLLCNSCYNKMNRYGTTDKDKIKQIPGFGTKSNSTFYNINNTCVRCNIDLTSNHPMREYDEQKSWTGNWLCKDCWYITDYKFRPDNQHNLEKSIANSRTGNLDRLNSYGKMMIGQWITGKTLGIEDLNIINNHLREPIDHSIHHIYGNIDTKAVSYDNYNRWWSIANITHNFDRLCIQCMDDKNPWTMVQRTYMILEKEITGGGITIVKNLTRGGWYEEFRIDDKAFNDTYQSVEIPRYFSPFDLWKGKYDRRK